MTYAGTTDNMFTLAHELGHAYHTFTLKDKPFLAVTYPMGLAETASILNELVTNDSALAVSTDKQERLNDRPDSAERVYLLLRSALSLSVRYCVFMRAGRKGGANRTAG